MKRPSRPRRLDSIAPGEVRLALLLSVALVGLVVAVGSLATPLVGWSGWPEGVRSEPEAVVRVAVAEPTAEPARRSDRAAGRDRAGRRGASGSPSSSTTRLASFAAPRDDRVRSGRPRRAVHSPGSTDLPVSARSSADRDRDGLPDAWELSFRLDPRRAADAKADTDGDGLDNLTELKTRNDPTTPDTDADGLRDGQEDYDGDSLHNDVELRASSKPWEADSNEDGITDDQDDADGDGLVNLLEQELDSDPGEPAPAVETGPAEATDGERTSPETGAGDSAGTPEPAAGGDAGAQAPAPTPASPTP